MRGEAAQVGKAPAIGRRGRRGVLRFDPRRADPRGWRLLELVAAARRLEPRQLLGPDRGKAEIALARQLAMYLMHTQFSGIYSDVGRFFGRDRTTVSHACALIEDLRDESAFDEEVGALEAALEGEAALAREASRAAA